MKRMEKIANILFELGNITLISTVICCCIGLVLVMWGIISFAEYFRIIGSMICIFFMFKLLGGIVS